MAVLLAASMLTAGPVFGSFVQAAPGTERWVQLPVKCEASEESLDKVLSDKREHFATDPEFLFSGAERDQFRKHFIEVYGPNKGSNSLIGLIYVVIDQQADNVVVAWVQPNNCIRYATYIQGSKKMKRIIERVRGLGI